MTRKFFQYLFSTLFLFLSLIACEKEINNKQEVDDPVEPVIEFSSSDFTIGPDGGDFTFAFAYPNIWGVSSDVNWIHIISTDYSNGQNKITYSVAANDTYDQRNGALTLKAGNSTKKITVTQKQKNAILLSTNKIEIGADGGSSNLEVQANIEYQVKIDELCSDWVSIVSTKGLSASTVSLVIDKNSSSDNRTGKVTIYNRDKDEDVFIYQKGSTPSIVLSQKEFNVPSEGTEIKIEVESNTGFTIQMPDVNWIQETTTKATNSYTYYFTVSKNTSRSARSAEIVFNDNKHNISDTVKIYQLGYESSGEEDPTDPETSDVPLFKETVELIFLVWRLAGANEFNQCDVQSLNSSIDNYFTPYISHKAIKKAQEIRSRYGTGYDGVGALGIRLKIENGKIVFNDKYSKTFDTRWPSGSVDPMVEALNDFYADTDFHNWYMTWESLRESAIESFQKKVTVDYDWFDSFFWPIENKQSRILLSFIIGPHNFGVSIDKNDGATIMSPIIGCMHENGNNIAQYGSDVSTVIHEFCHPYCNPLNEKYWNLISDKADEVFATVESKMRSQAYGQAMTMMNETLVRSCEIRYMLDHYLNYDKERIISYEEQLGFVLVRDLVDLLEIREKKADQYKTLEDFYPEIAKVINNYTVVVYSGNYPEYTNNSTPDLLPGVFSVSETKKVRFTKGNLYWNGNDWAFEENQMNSVFCWDNNHIGHFFWEPTIERAITTKYYKSNTSLSDKLFCDGSDNEHYLTVKNINNLRVLNSDRNNGELSYLIIKRKNAQKLYKYPVIINGVGKCLVLAPDDYSGSINDSYDSTAWKDAESNGLVCLAPTGMRYETNIDQTNIGQYWSSTIKTDSDNYAWVLYFIGETLYHSNCYSPRQNASAIRLVQDVE